MIITDRIYGKITIEEPVIIDLIHSKPFQRLKGISQDGVSHFIQPLREGTRYEHSIGTWYLSNRYKRSIEEQIASLLHDLPHTAFSHVSDFVMQDKNHEYHDRFINEVIINSEIPEILKKHHLELPKILAKEAYPLLDNKLPDISVDRYDYFLRDGFMFHLLPKETVQLFLTSIKERDEKFYFEDLSIAGLFSVMFMNCSRLIWLDPSSHGAFFLMSEAIKLALKKGFIVEKDFFATDAVLMSKLIATKDPEILAFLNRLKPGKQFHYAPKETAEFYGPNKPRFVDPWVLSEGKLHLMSDLIPGMKEYFAEYVKTHTDLGVSQD
jgi:HD superfamily phosphohydrolase